MPSPTIDDLALERQKTASAYAERNKVVLLAAKMAIALGLKAELWRHPDEDKSWEDDWRWIVAIQILTGSSLEKKWVTWHIHDSEYCLFSFLDQADNKWDGHSTFEKYERVLSANFTKVDHATTKVDHATAQDRQGNTEKIPLTLSEIMAQPLPEITPEYEAELKALDRLFGGGYLPE